MNQLVQKQTKNWMQQLLAILFLLFSTGSLLAQCPTGISGGPSGSVVCGPSPSYSLSGGDATSTWNLKQNGIITSTGSGATFSVPSISATDDNVEVELITSGCGQQTISFHVRNTSFTYSGGAGWYDVDFTENTSVATWSGPGTNWADGGNHNVFSGFCQDGSGTVTLTTGDGCTVSGPVSYSGLNLALSSSSSTIACGGTATFTPSFASYASDVYSVSPNNAGTMSGNTFTAAVGYSGSATISYSADFKVVTSKGNSPAFNCSASTTISVNCATCNLSLSPSSTNVSCNGGSNGSASVSASGANGTVSYSWSNGGSSSSINNLAPGTYVCTATDGGMSGCTSSVSVTISEPSSAVSASCSGNNVTTAGGSDGSASVSAGGGTPAYTYLWSNGGTGSSISNLTAGTYSVVVTDANGCTSACTSTLTQPILTCNLSLSPSSTDVSCNGGSNGSASVSVSGANGSVSYSWSNGGSSSSISNLSAGTYVCTATDGGMSGCTTSVSITINQPSSSVSVSCSPTNVTTVGGSNGSVSVNASGGTPGYTYLWSNGGTSSSISNLTAGTYSVVVTDANGCSSNCTTSVTDPICNLTIAATLVDVNCHGGIDGEAVITPTGFTGNVQYSWSNSASGSSAVGLAAGSYNVTATDGVGCTSNISFSINQPSTSVSANCSSTNVTTPGGSNGTASVSASGGTPGYSYLWSNGGTGSSISGLPAGNYSVIVTDANGCSATCNTSVTAPGCTLSISPSQTNILCNGGSNGSASVTASGASGSVTYAWSNSGTSNSITGLSAGTYSVLVTDAASCSVTASFNITQPTSVVSASCSSTNVTTVGGSNGTASVSANGGTPGYTYLWSNGGTSSSISNLTAGTYNVVVTDANGCTAACTSTVTQPIVTCNLSLTPSQTNILCNGGTNGSASVSVSGANGSVSYSWSNGGSSSSINNLAAGTYVCTVTDGGMSGCTASVSITITQPSSALTINCSSTNVTASGGSNGSASVSVSGGTPSYSYLWSNSGTGATISNLIAGNYSVLVTDANGCSATCASTVNQPGCNINAVISNLVCNNMGTTTTSDDRYSFDITVTNPGSSVGNWTCSNSLVGGASYGIAKNVTNQFLVSGGQISFTVADGANASCSQVVTVTPPTACSAPCNLNHVVTSITKINSTTLGITFTISGSNGGSWSAIQKTDPTGTLAYNTLLTGMGDGTFTTTAPLISYTDNFGYGGQGFVFRTTLDGYTDCMDDEFLMLPKACLGNYVWNDINKDGIQNNNEVGVAGITVTLYDNLNTIWGTTITDAYGYYQFCSLTPGFYHIGVTLPINYKFTTSNTIDDLLDSDVDSLTGLTPNYVIAAGDSNMTLDAGIYYQEITTASVGNYVWLDTDHDGIQDASENGISGVTVILYNSSNQVVATMLTNSQGYYLFTNVIPGVYSVKFIAPVGLIFSPNNGSIDAATNSDANSTTGLTSIFTVNAGDHISYIDAGLYSQPTINGGLGDKVWYDLNQDGIQDVNEPGVSNVLVTLYQADGSTAIQSAKTDAYGNYIFNNLPQGQYVIGFANLPSGYVLTSTTGTDSTSNSDANTTTAKTQIINLGAGQFNMTYDAGIYTNIPANNNSIGNYVWYDMNSDGIQDATEQGVSGVTVTLYSNTNTILSMTSTDDNGMYLFPDLPNGTYYVGFSNIPPSYTFSIKGAGTTLTDNNADKSTGLTDTIILSGNTHNMTIDAGINPGGVRGTQSLGDYVWYDLNNNGLQEVNESGVSGVLVTLYYSDGISSVKTTTTDALGNYIFTDLKDTSYIVGFTNLPVGYSISPKNADNTGINGELNNDVNSSTQKTDVVVLGLGDENMNIDMGIVPPSGSASLGNFVWFDLNNDGLQTASEPGVQGISVALYNSLDSIIKTTTTDVNGEYYFIGLTPGTYHVGFSNLPVGYSFTTYDANTNGINGATNSDANVTNGQTATVTLASGDNNLNLDAGIKSTIVASVGDYVWLDVNRDGVQDANESGVSGVLVTLYNSSNVSVASAITKADGSYIFTNVIPGTYTIGFSNIPSGYIFTSKETDPLSNTGSNANPINGMTNSFTVLAGTHNPTIDAGITTPQVTGLGNYVWFDSNEDGLQDASEPPVPGAIVTLYAQNGTTVLATAVTNGNGAYSFTNLDAGTYIVGFSNFPTGYYKTRSVGTLNDATNSDLGAFNKTAPITLALGTYNPNIDAGIMFGFPLNAKELKATTAIINNNSYDCNINWYTVEEINTQLFNIERSTNAIDFETVGITLAKGSTFGKVNYSFIDNVEALKDASVIYYRIRLIDIDGKETVSNVVNTRQSNTEGEITIYPVPFVDQLSIAYSSISSSTINVSITDISGRVVSTVDKDVTMGNNTVEIAGLLKLPSGTYFIKIVDDYNGNKFIKKINK